MQRYLKILSTFKTCLKPKQLLIPKQYIYALSNNSLKYEISKETKRKIIGWWLVGCSGCVFFTIVIGGLTRLTESGLSMVNWHLFKEIPPFNQKAWLAEFENYKLYPEYELKNSEITLNEFKRIWFTEWAHRMSGRITGLIFAIPAIIFACKGWFKQFPAMNMRLLAYFGLLGFQGLLGWYMVKSGLTQANKEYFEDIPRVSQYRLAAHLGTALVLYALMLWASLGFLSTPNPKLQLPLFQEGVRVNPLRLVRRLAHSSKTLIFLTAISGAFVAGLDAGLVYNTFPKMGQYWIPPDLFHFRPAWKNVFENPTTVQFNHRIMATATLGLVVFTWFLTRRLPPNLRTKRVRYATNCMTALTAVQISLGIFALLKHVPVWLGSLHQTGSLVLLSNAIWLTHELRRIPKI